MIGQFKRGKKFRPKQESAIFDTLPITEQAGLFVAEDQIWEVDGYNEVDGVYILICRNLGLALKLGITDIETLFNEVDS